jgi:hypothetical protein
MTARRLYSDEAKKNFTPMGQKYFAHIQQANLCAIEPNKYFAHMQQIKPLRL